MRDTSGITVFGVSVSEAEWNWYCEDEDNQGLHSEATMLAVHLWRMNQQGFNYFDALFAEIHDSIAGIELPF